MGLVSSRFNLDRLNLGRRRSQQDETLYTYALNKNFFTNYFFMGGERFEVSDPDYLFGDNCDLNFLGCAKPYTLPYKQAQQNLLSTINTKQKATNKASSRVNRFSSTFNSRSSGNQEKQDAQTQTLTSSKGGGSEPSQPLVMFINIRKETLRLVKTFAVSNLDANADAQPDELGTSPGSLMSARSSIRSGYTSVKEGEARFTVDDDDNSSDNDDDFKDALNDTTNLSHNEDEDSEGTQQQKSLLSEKKVNTATTLVDSAVVTFALNNTDESSSSSTVVAAPAAAAANRIYNIEFTFDAEVDCFIRIFYFCTKESTSSGINYKPQHATYRSKVYYYKRGLNQKFDQPDHTFQPYLFDEDLLIYKPPDSEGNYNKSGTVYPIVILMGALEGSEPMQSLSLIATIEKSQLDDSYSIKPVKQLVFVDGIQYIIQEIYGIENKQLLSSPSSGNQHPKSRRHHKSRKDFQALKSKSRSLQSNLDSNLSDTASVISVDPGITATATATTQQQQPKSNENTFECVICMSEERDTMLLPCRHLCLCSSCAQSLRYQANSCPICRCPFRAALNLRAIQPNTLSGARRNRREGGGRGGEEGGGGSSSKGGCSTPLRQQITATQGGFPGTPTPTAMQSREARSSHSLEATPSY